MRLLLQHIVLRLTSLTLELDVALTHRTTCIFGPSGAGKTSLLDLIAGLRRPERARIQLNDSILTDTTTGTLLAPRWRRIGYVPQDLALFPHLSVKQNLLYGYQPRAESSSLFSLQHVTEVLQIESLLPRDVTALSGGEKQRVALARALLTSPSLLLLDEPLASLDGALKKKILPYLCSVRDEFQLPILYVTHDQEEVEALCEDVVVLEHGRLVAHGSPRELWSQSRSPPTGASPRE